MCVADGLHISFHDSGDRADEASQEFLWTASHLSFHKHHVSATSNVGRAFWDLGDPGTRGLGGSGDSGTRLYEKVFGLSLS